MKKAFIFLTLIALLTGSINIYSSTEIRQNKIYYKPASLKGKIPYENRTIKIIGKVVPSRYLGLPAKKFLIVKYPYRVTLNGKIISHRYLRNILDLETLIRGKMRGYRLIKRRSRSIYINEGSDLQSRRAKLYTYSLLGKPYKKNYYIFVINGPVNFYVFYINFVYSHEGIFARKVIYKLYNGIKLYTPVQQQTPSTEGSNNEGNQRGANEPID